MQKIHKTFLPSLAIFGSLLILSGCTSPFVSDNPNRTPTSQMQQERRIYNTKHDRILLIHPQSREVIACDSFADTSSGIISQSVELCAARAEQLGFKRVTDLPRFIAVDDEIVYTNYPSRRFRGRDETPRW